PAAPTPQLYTLSLPDALPICSADGGSISLGSSRGSRTCTRSRAGFGVTPAKSSTIASAVTLLRIDSRALPFPSSAATSSATSARSEEHTSELQSRSDLVCRLL